MIELPHRRIAHRRRARDGHGRRGPLLPGRPRRVGGPPGPRPTRSAARRSRRTSRGSSTSCRTARIDVTGPDPARARRRRVHRPVRRPRPVVHRPARAVHHGRAEERGPALPPLHRPPGDRPGRLGRRAPRRRGPSTTSRRPSSTEIRALVRRGDAAPRAAAAAARRHRDRRPAGQRDRDAGLGHATRPDLTDDLLARPRALVRRAARRRRQPYPVDPTTLAGPRPSRSPDEAWAGPLRVDLGRFMRDRFAAYVAALREMAEGQRRRATSRCSSTSTAPRAATACPSPSGSASWSRPTPASRAWSSGSDHYLGEVTLDTTTDIHFINACMDAVNGARPAAHVAGVRGGDRRLRRRASRALYDPSTADLKTRLCLAQGNRLDQLLPAGRRHQPAARRGRGRRQRPDQLHRRAPRDGGADRSPGRARPGFAATDAGLPGGGRKRSWLADMDEEHDDLALGFVLDAFMTEYHHPGSRGDDRRRRRPRGHRGPGQRKALWRSLLFAGYRFGAVDLQDPDPAPGISGGARHGSYLSRAGPAALRRPRRAGGGLLLLGRLPERDLEERQCTVLADALGLGPARSVRDTGHYYPVGRRATAGPLRGPETRVGWRQELAPEPRRRRADRRRTARCAGSTCPRRRPGVVLAAELPSDPDLFDRALAAPRCAPRGVDRRRRCPGVITTTTASEDGQRALHLINISGAPMRDGHRRRRRALRGGRSRCRRARGTSCRSASTSRGVRLVGGTGEVAGVEDGAISFCSLLGVGDSPGHSTSPQGPRCCPTTATTSRRSPTARCA